MRRTIIAVAIIAIVLIGIIGYALTGFAYAQTRIGNADRTLNTVISHQNNLNSTFKDIDTKFNALSSSSTFDPKAAHTLFDQFVANAKSAEAAIGQDDASLVAAKASLGEQQWLTVVSRGSLDKEAVRIDHARTGLSEARNIAADYVQDGQFFLSFLDSAADLETLSALSANADLGGARTTLSTLKTHVDKALQLSTAPGLPTELHALMVDFESLVTDFGKLLDAATSGDNAAITSAEMGVQTDADKISKYDFAKIGAAIGAFYKPMVEIFNAEMAKASS